MLFVLLWLDVLLSTFLREKLGLRGTKLGCEEGGCGACTVILQSTENSTPLAVNACLRLLVSCDGAYITTVEGIGSISQGLSVEQSQMVRCSATQCGYCTPGWVTAHSSCTGRIRASGFFVFSPRAFPRSSGVQGASGGTGEEQRAQTKRGEHHASELPLWPHSRLVSLRALDFAHSTFVHICTSSSFSPSVRRRFLP